MTDLKPVRYLYLFLVTACLMLFQAAAEAKTSRSEGREESEEQEAAELALETLGVPEYVPTLGLTSLATDAHLVQFVDKRTITDGEEARTQAFLVQSTDEKGNIDLRIKYEPGLVHKDERLVENIEQMVRLEYRLNQYAETYDKKSLQVTDLGGGETLIKFSYSRFALPQDISYFRHVRAEMRVVDGEVVSMELTNDKPFTFAGIKVDSYHQRTEFAQLPSGKVVVKRKRVRLEGTVKGKPVTKHIEVLPVAYYDSDSQPLVADEDLLSRVSDPRVRETKVKLRRTFPLMGDMVRRKGIDLPLPFGVSMSYRNQNMDVGFNSFSVLDLPPEVLEVFFDPAESTASVNAESVTFRGDVNILPFWNVYGLVGKVNIDADVAAKFKGICAIEVAGQCIKPIVEEQMLHVPLDLTYNLTGIGTTLSIGYKQFFASLTGTYTRTKLEGGTGDGSAVVTAQPMVGYQMVDWGAQIFVGAEYQGLKDYMRGELGPVGPFDNFTFDVGVNVDRWTGLIGFNKQFGKHYRITGIYNLGPSRDSFTLNLNYRF
ncbi:hypothetical protein [Ferrimonas gelatinilytica]|uniref:Uncharacterized protein n=1 Tax=Ferrimonas gelatinilytica TaxID=1255257 RepID=A0ABP9RX76_9GAMM